MLLVRILVCAHLPVHLLFWLFIDHRKTDQIPLMNFMCLHLIWLQVTYICHLWGLSFECPVYFLSFKESLSENHLSWLCAQWSSVLWFSTILPAQKAFVCFQTRFCNCFEKSILNVSLGLRPGYFPPHHFFPCFTHHLTPIPISCCIIRVWPLYPQKPQPSSMKRRASG